MTPIAQSSRSVKTEHLFTLGEQSMKQQTNPHITWALWWSLTLAAGLAAINITGDNEMGLIILLVGAWVILFIVATRGKTEHLSPWSMQRFCMNMSGQTIPLSPQLNRTALLYYALILEEASEAGESLMRILTDHLYAHAAGEAPENFEALAKISQAIHSAQMSTHFESTAIRNLLNERLGAHWGGIPLTLKQASSLADDTTDIQVVNSGFALSLGLPGEKCYAEVFGSNVSKANPTTGLIDKTPDGKWIKGKDFYKPDIATVLREYFPAGTFDEQVTLK